MIQRTDIILQFEGFQVNYKSFFFNVTCYYNIKIDKKNVI